MKEKTNANGLVSSPDTIDRRKFIGGIATATLGFTIIPAHVLGGPRHIAPSDKINVAYIGTGTQGLGEMPALLNIPEVQIIAVCDPQKEAVGYFDWGPTGLRDRFRNTIGKTDWMPGGDNRIPGGRDNGKEMVEGYYAHARPGKKYKGCAAYSDFREMFEKEKDIDAVKVMTPDHLHGILAMAAMKRGIHVTMHKPVSNRLHEGLKVIEMAKESKVTTHLIAWDSNGNMDQVMAWINGGVIGNLREIHNWSNRPVWPQYAEIPSDKPEPKGGLDWDLWLGPEANRPYHPHYTHMVFRGWYDFGGGAMADMGHYSLWCVLKALDLKGPEYIEPSLSHFCGHSDQSTAFKVRNDYSFPFAGSVRFKYPATSKRNAVDLIWYDGGMRPPVPDEFYSMNKEFPAEGLMFKGDKGIIMSSQFLLREPYVLTGDQKLTSDLTLKTEEGEKLSGIQKFINGVKDGSQVEGSFRDAGSITEAVNLYAAAMRSDKILKFDSQKNEIVNVPEANAYLSRDYRPGWAPVEI
jgi:hypothetical protein